MHVNKSVGVISLKNKEDDEPTYTGTGWFVAKEESESYIMTNYHVISAIKQRRRQTQREIKVHILIRAALYPLYIIISSDPAMAEDSSNFRWPNETSSEASSSGNCLVTVRL
jgi:S1-C subfamily serine protease